MGEIYTSDLVDIAIAKGEELYNSLPDEDLYYKIPDKFVELQEELRQIICERLSVQFNNVVEDNNLSMKIKNDLFKIINEL